MDTEEGEKAVGSSEAAPSEQEAAPPQQEETFRGRHKRKVHPVKLRNKIMSISVSPEEEKIIRSFLADKGWSFSGWARESMFRSMGKKVPSRRNKYRPPRFHKEDEK